MMRIFQQQDGSDLPSFFEDCSEHETEDRLRELNSRDDGFLYYAEPSTDDEDPLGVPVGIIHKGSDGISRWCLERGSDNVMLADERLYQDDMVINSSFMHVCAYENHDAHVRALPGEILERRLTHGYVGSWKYLDQHEYVGRFLIEATNVLDNEVDPEDPCEPCTTTLFVKVFSGQSEMIVKQALQDHFTLWGCSHEYDCCGCRSYRSGRITRLGNGYWKVVQHSSRNY